MPLVAPGLSLPATNKVIVPSSTTILIDGSIIGFIQELSEDSGRTVDRVRELSGSRAGKVVEQVPGVENVTLRGTRFCLYEGNPVTEFLKEQGEVDGPIFAITQQYIPFDVRVEERHPNSSADKKGFYVVFGECWFTRAAHSLRIGDLHIIDSFDLQPKEIARTGWLTSNVTAV